MPAISFDLNAIDWNLTLIAGRALFLLLCFALAAIAFARWRRAIDRGNEQSAAQAAQIAQRLTDVDARIEATQQILIELSQRLAELSTSAANSTARSYQIAIRMARAGVALDEVMASCGLTRQEAELVQRLHAPRRARMTAVG